MTTRLDATLLESLRVREEEGLLRELRSNDDNARVDFYSNDYLSLAADPALLSAIAKQTAALPAAGSTGSRLISGNSEQVESLEAEIADFHRGDAALMFNSGYAANTALFACLLGSGDTLITDRLVHASILDGVQLGKARHVRFRHNDVDHLESRLRAAEGTNVLVGVESTYSMDGDSAPLAEIVDLADRFGAAVVVDEAHSVGINGPGGAGAVVDAGLEDRIYARVCTFGKALGLHGAAIIGSDVLRRYLVNFARPFIYSTAPTPHTVESIRAVYRMLPLLDERRERLRAHIHYFRERLPASRFRWMQSETPIQSVIIPGNAEVREMAERLRAAGYEVTPIVAPTVPAGTERIRITLHANTNPRDIDTLFEVLECEDEV